MPARFQVIFVLDYYLWMEIWLCGDRLLSESHAAEEKKHEQCLWFHALETLERSCWLTTEALFGFGRERPVNGQGSHMGRSKDRTTDDHCCQIQLRSMD